MLVGKRVEFSSEYKGLLKTADLLLGADYSPLPTCKQLFLAVFLRVMVGVFFAHTDIDVVCLSV